MKTVITGGAGFIGSHLVDRLLGLGHHVMVIDNLSGGRMELIAHHRPSSHFRFIKLDIRRTNQLTKALSPNIDTVFHLAANADIARGATDPTLDFEHSLVGTFSLLQAMRHWGLKKIVYTSGSGVYGDRGHHHSTEQTGPLTPVSMYGATKLGAEGLISAFAHLFGMRAWIVRPANIIGPRATHGVVLDFVKQLTKHPGHLRILGDGRQSKAYIYVEDVINALLLIHAKAHGRVNIFNVSSHSFLTVHQLANVVTKRMGLKTVKLEHTGGRHGWKGDVPVVRLQSIALRKLGWQPHYSATQAVTKTVTALLQNSRSLQQ